VATKAEWFAASTKMLEVLVKTHEAIKSDSSVYQCYLKRCVARDTGRAFSGLRDMPYVEWAPIRDAYLETHTMQGQPR
jgi:hypothetical protein